MKKALVLGAGGFIGSHLVKKLKHEGLWVRGVDLKYPLYSATQADDFIIGDLRDQRLCCEIMKTHDIDDEPFDEVYQLAADVGGAGYISTGEHDADIMQNSALINLNVLTHSVDFQNQKKYKRIFYSSSTCVYSEDSQQNDMKESSVYPAQPDGNYGWEKLFSERLYLAFHKNYGVDVHIARYHNIFGPEGTWEGGREKAVDAICRKIAEAKEGGEIQIWGDGTQIRSFLYIDECIEGTLQLMRSDCTGPFNIGPESENIVTINDLTWMIQSIADKSIKIKHIEGPEGMHKRVSNSRFIYEELGWRSSRSLMEGLKKTYPWILEQVKNKE